MDTFEPHLHFWTIFATRAINNPAIVCSLHRVDDRR